MKRLVLRIVIILLLSGTCFAEAFDQNTPYTWYVRADGDDSNSGNSWQTGVATINHALSIVPDGGTIVLGPGTFSETVDFSSKTGLAIVGYEFGSSTISSSVASGQIVKMGNYGRLSNLIIENTAAVGSSCNGVVALNRVGLRIDNCIISANDYAVKMTASSTYRITCQISGSIIHGSEYGIYVSGASSSLPSELLIRNCEITTSDWTNCKSVGLLVMGNMLCVARDSIINARGSSVTVGTTAIMLFSNAETYIPKAVIENCAINATHLDDAQPARGVEVFPRGLVMVNGCIINATDYTLYNYGTPPDGVITVSNSLYDPNKVSGTIYEK